MNWVSSDNYEFENGWINLIDKTLVYNENFLVDGDFTITIRCKDIYRNSTFLKCYNENSGFTLSSYIHDGGGIRYKLIVPNGTCNLIKYSEPLYPNPNDIPTIHIRRINGVYGLYCFTDIEAEEINNIWFGANQPSLTKLDNYDIWLNTDNTNSVRIDKNDVNIFYQEDEPVFLVENNFDIWIGGNEL